MDAAVWIQVLTGNIVLCSWASHFTPIVPLSIQEYRNSSTRAARQILSCDGLEIHPTGVPMSC